MARALRKGPASSPRKVAGGIRLGRSTDREKRSAPRIPVRERISVLYPEFESTIRDLSLAGAFIEDKRPLRVGQTLRLRIPGNRGPIDVLAMVRRVEPGTGMGVEFLEMNHSSHEHLRLLVSRLSSSPTSNQ